MKRRAKYVFLSWLRTLVNKLSPDDIVSYHYDDMEDAMEDWGSKISEQNVQVLIVIEGLTMYLNAKDVQQIFAVISSRFSQATIFVETMNPTIVRHFKEKSIDANIA